MSLDNFSHAWILKHKDDHAENRTVIEYGRWRESGMDRMGFDMFGHDRRGALRRLWTFIFGY